MRVKQNVLMLLLLSLTGARTLMAQVVAVIPGDGGFQNANYGADVTLGWGFFLSTTLTVTDLGYFDADSGLADAHPVGIWDANGNLIAEAIVPVGMGSILDDGFSFVPITPVTLGPGTYTIGGYGDVTSTDEFRFDVPSITAVAGLSFGPVDLYTQGSSLMEPTRKADVFTQAGYFGPDFLAGSVTPVPEPGSFGLCLVVIAALALERLRRGRRCKETT